jgi:tetratricopeptide (TPR) repeat protein
MKRDPAAARAGLGRHGVDLVLVRHHPYPITRRTNPGILEAVQSDPEWQLLYVDDLALLYARRLDSRGLPEALDGFDPARFRLDDPDGARPELEVSLRRALERAPSSAFVLFALAESLRAQGRDDEAIAELERAWQANPRFRAAPQRAGEVALAAGRRDEARRWFERARDAAPEWQRPRRSLEALGP